MTKAELRKRAEEDAANCRSREREEFCPYLLPGAPLGHDDCPMRPHKCRNVTAKMWLEAYREYDLFEEEDE